MTLNQRGGVARAVTAAAAAATVATAAVARTSNKYVQFSHFFIWDYLQLNTHQLIVIFSRLTNFSITYVVNWRFGIKLIKLIVVYGSFPWKLDH